MKEQSKKGKELGLKEYRVHMGLFDFAVLVVTGDYKKISEYVAWKNDDKDFHTDNFDHGYDCRGKCFYRAGYVPIVWLPRKPKTAREHATFAHECGHAIFHLFEWASLAINRETEEVFNHALAHIIANVKFN